MGHRERRTLGFEIDPRPGALRDLVQAIESYGLSIVDLELHAGESKSGVEVIVDGDPDALRRHLEAQGWESA